MIKHHENLSLSNIVEEIDGIVYEEEWVPIVGFEGSYSISSFGRVMSHPRKSKIKSKNRTNYTLSKGGIILRHKYNNRRYHMVSLSLEGKQKYFTVHRLVGLHFIPNPENKPQINHKFGDKDDNRKWMLEWNTNSENGIHSFRELGRLPAKLYLGKFGKNHNRSKPILQYDLEGNFIKEWENGQEIRREYGWSSANIQRACLKRKGINHPYGFRWEYKIK